MPIMDLVCLHTPESDTDYLLSIKGSHIKAELESGGRSFPHNSAFINYLEGNASRWQLQTFWWKDSLWKKASKGQSNEDMAFSSMWSLYHYFRVKGAITTHFLYPWPISNSVDVRRSWWCIEMFLFSACDAVLNSPPPCHRWQSQGLIVKSNQF